MTPGRGRGPGGARAPAAAPRPVVWQELGRAAASLLDGRLVEVEGFMHSLRPGARRTDYFALAADPACCVGCLPRAPGRRIEVLAAEPLVRTGAALRLVGRFRLLDPGACGWRYQLSGARLLTPARLSRRRMLAGVPALPAGLVAACAVPADLTARQAIEGVTTIDMHSHAGGIASRRFVEGTRAAYPVAAPMRAGGMAVACLAVVSDGPTHRVMADRRIHPFRTPAPGELYEYGMKGFARLHRMAAAQGLGVIRTRAELAAARAGSPGVVVTAEGADFLEGRIERVDEAYARWGLRQLQLTHYRVNELGDIQTEPPEHGGLAAFGAAVIERCNQLGILVDVAHGTEALVARAAEVTTRPLVLSHTSLATRPRPFSRTIPPAHARLVAASGGVIGIWPPVSIFPDKMALAAGIARMVAVVGIDHVGLGSDMNGLFGASAFASYEETPALVEALLRHGFGPEEVRKLMGGNYARVLAQSLAG